MIVTTNTNATFKLKSKYSGSFVIGFLLEKSEIPYPLSNIHMNELETAVDHYNTSYDEFRFKLSLKLIWKEALIAIIGLIISMFGALLITTQYGLWLLVLGMVFYSASVFIFMIKFLKRKKALFAKLNEITDKLNIGQYGNSSLYFQYNLTEKGRSLYFISVSYPIPTQDGNNSQPIKYIFQSQPIQPIQPIPTYQIQPKINNEPNQKTPLLSDHITI
ncbi:hypothetical protein DLAC_08850 [Tieghemostelium lacteum]|uniref:Uncharacterized protein n=1 Tax=Tieghemostelium lacteum TaxID=361077 RepID=A0A151Z8H9_TIELA|nr:hypothetical protein DLAC_08850 [Tieghemostelium lacteum]|eukprot:KYQ90247.1 hypothetical protein DLAC_08850 [Tieghemostelium lacteum]